MTPREFKAGRMALGLSVEAFARTFGVASGRNVRRWETGEREDGSPAPIPRPIAILLDLALHVPGARERMAWLETQKAPPPA